MRKKIQKLSVKEYCNNEWEPVIDFFWKRYNSRYFYPIKYLQESSDSLIKYNCGFLIITIDCVLIETLQQFYNGTDETELKKTDDAFYQFFQRCNLFKNTIKNKADAGKFAGLIRSGLLHQSKIKKNSIININETTPLLDWVDEKNKHIGFKLNRDKFHSIVFEQFELLIENLKKPENETLRKNFIRKLLTIAD